MVRADTFRVPPAPAYQTLLDENAQLRAEVDRLRSMMPLDDEEPIDAPDAERDRLLGYAQELQHHRAAHVKLMARLGIMNKPEAVAESVIQALDAAEQSRELAAESLLALRTALAEEVATWHAEAEWMLDARDASADTSRRIRFEHVASTWRAAAGKIQQLIDRPRWSKS